MFIYQDHVYFPSLPHIYFTNTMIVSPFSTCLFNFSMFYPLPHVYLPRPCFLPITTCLFTKTMFFYPLPHVYLTLACLTHYHMFIYHDHVFYPLPHVYLPRPCFFTHYYMFIYQDYVCFIAFSSWPSCYTRPAYHVLYCILYLYLTPDCITLQTVQLFK